MRYTMRMFLDKLFTVLTAASVILMIIALITILGPMTAKGLTAVFFNSTVEFRRLQFDQHGRGLQEDINEQIKRTNEYKEHVYVTLDRFSKGITTDSLADEAKYIYRQFGKDIRNDGATGEELTERRAVAKQIRDDLETAFESTDKAEVMAILDGLEEYKSSDKIAGTIADDFFVLAEEYRQIIKDFDLTRRHQYADELNDVQSYVLQLFGPRPGDDVPAMVMERYGATRLDLAKELLYKITWKEEWLADEASENGELVLTRTRRQEIFAGTMLAEIFPYIEENFDNIVESRPTFYWQFFVDDSTSGHYFGGIGPEIIGTLMLTVLSMVFVFPLGVISAAYLVECASENIVMRIIRMCINTLAGVPSIVFGLFGLAFFVMVLMPAFGAESKPSILTASLTLAVLTLPVMIRASEEAIRSVPRAYKEASLGLGASQFRTFVKVTLPAAMPGILTGVILSLSRVAGETAPILFTGAVAYGAIPKSIFDQTRTLSYGSYDLAVGDFIGMQVPHNQYGMVVTLVLLIICLNAIAIYFRARIFKRLKGH